MIRQVADEMVAEKHRKIVSVWNLTTLKLQKRKWIIHFGYAVQEQLYLHILVLYHLHSKQNSRKGWIYMKKRKLAAGIAAAALVAVLSVSAVYAGNQGKSVLALWGEILKQSADEEKINTQSADDEPLYAVGKDVSSRWKNTSRSNLFYKLKSEDDGQAAKDADKEIKQYNALYAAGQSKTAICDGWAGAAYIEDMKLQLESVDNSEDIQDVIDQFDSEDDYWAYEFTVYQKQRRSRIMCQR